MPAKILRNLLILPLAITLGGCNLVLLHPSGTPGKEESVLFIISAVLTGVIIIPVLIAIAVIAIRYRHSNKNARYEPEWDHSNRLELLMWAAPILIITVLGAVTWVDSHKLDPFRPLSRVEAVSAGSPAVNPVSPVKPLTIDVVSLEWKWLFFYPRYGIATVNQVAAPVNVPITFNLTATTMMNSFFIPALAGQIYNMPNMQTQLHAEINKVGNYRGFSANFSGHGFTNMRFRFLGLTAKGFSHWVRVVETTGTKLSRQTYLGLAKPSSSVPVHYYASYMPGLYNRILNRCVKPGQLCLYQVMAIDAQGGRPIKND